MTTSLPRSPRLLVLGAAAFGVAGITLLAGPRGDNPPVSAPLPTLSAAATAGTHASAPIRVRSTGTPSVRATTSSTPKRASMPWASASVLPPHGEGVAGDQVIQRTLDAAWPADLPAQDERELLAAGRALLRADATGVGRARWPGVFRDSGRAVAPAFATTRFRIQAALARRDGRPDKAVVHLVWAGADRGGTFTDDRITDLYFTSTSTKGAATWTPQPRT